MANVIHDFIYDICHSGNLEAAVQQYALYYHYLDDYTFIFAAEKGATPGLSVNRNFSSGSAVRSLFKTPHVFILTPDIFREMFISGNRVTFPIDYSISLDTQVLSYLKPFFEGQRSRLPDDFEEIFDFIAREEVNVDPLLYELENLCNFSDLNKQEKIFERIRAYEMLRNLDVAAWQQHRQLKFNVSEQEIIAKTQQYMARKNYEFINKSLMEELARDYNRLYVYVLKMCAIHLRNPKTSAKQVQEKLLELLEFTHNEAHFFGIREILLAKRFFENGSKEAFFHKVNRNTAGFWEYVRGMAWDLRHQRFLEFVITLNIDKNAAFFFPAILTCDKKFIEVLDAHSVKVIVFKNKTKEILPFYDVDFIEEIASCGERVKERLTLLSTEEYQLQRRQYQEGPDYLQSLVKTLEAELEGICGIACEKNPLGNY